MSETLFTGISQLVTPLPGPKRGTEMSKLQVIREAAMLVRNGVIAWLGSQAQAPNAPQVCDLGGRAVVPGLVDPHTHAVWAGNRLADFEARTRGIPYETLLEGGGGIHSTILRTQAVDIETLVNLAKPRLRSLLASGATTIEIKSGYGMDFVAEKKMLEAVAVLQTQFLGLLCPTLLIHVPSLTGRQEYMTGVCDELIPEISALKLASAVDVFCEKKAFSVQETRQIFLAAYKYGLRVKAHADQFFVIGGTELACELGALSVDHLEVAGSRQIAALAQATTVATLLPGVSLHLDLPAAPGRQLIDADACVAIGTDLNPGSSPLFSTQLALALAVRLNGLTAAEALTASTVNAAAALDLTDRGALVEGLRADFLVLASDDWRDLVYTLGGNPVWKVFVGGRDVD